VIKLAILPLHITNYSSRVQRFPIKQKEELKMKTINICMALAGMILLGSCAVTDIEPTKDFSTYKTFGFGEPEVDVKDPAYKSGLIDARIKNAVREEFRKRGIAYAANNPDVIVTYRTHTEDKVVRSGYAYPYAMRPFGLYSWRYGYWGFPGWYGWGYPYGPMERDYTEGTLIIDINDRRTGEHIWRGMVSGNVTSTSGLGKQLDKAVKAILKKYPVLPQEERLRIPGDEDVS
jgi:hypothetical protein